MSDADEPVDVPETMATYLRLRGLPLPKGKRRRTRRRVDEDEKDRPFAPGRDPHGLGDALAALSKQAGWQPHLSQEEVLLQWAEVVGNDTAQHTEAVSLADGMLTIRCDSTAWTRQLQYMRAQIMTTITQRYPDAGVQNIRFVGPDVPSWKWGPRTAPGRGPRDTYG